MSQEHVFQTLSPRPLAWRVPAHGTLAVEAGTAWLTVQGEPACHVLRAGCRLAVHRGQRLWISTWSAPSAGLRFIPQAACETPMHGLQPTRPAGAC
jgi:hypothetical protein